MLWSFQSGLQLSIDKSVRVFSKKYISRFTSTYIVVKDFVIGGFFKKDKNCGMVIDFFIIVFVFSEIINRVGIKIGIFESWYFEICYIMQLCFMIFVDELFQGISYFKFLIVIVFIIMGIFFF